MLISGNSIAAEPFVPSVGYFPDSFPRDPVNVNFFLEHILLGQVIEPLVTTGTDGNIEPAAADRWTVSNDGLTIRFHIRSGLVFSTGQPVTSKDFKFTLERHLASPASQSKEYLSLIRQITTPDAETLQISLTRPYVAIFKALCRDQLGALPDGWKFDPESPEPFTGSGPYRILKEDGHWTLVENPRYRHREEVEIKKWEIILSKDASKRSLPDLMPFEFSQAVDDLQKKHPELPTVLIKERLIQFFQSSAWWYPHGVRYQDPAAKAFAMGVVEELIRRRSQHLGMRRATGIIPEGIPGHLVEPVARKNPGKRNDLEVIKIAAFTRDYKLLADDADLQAVEKMFNIRIELTEAQQAKAHELKSSKPDILVFSFAGGFHDPEGFLTVITSNLGAPLNVVFGDTYSKYLEASAEADWIKRDQKYRALNGILASSSTMVPGWRYEAYRLRCAQLFIDMNNLRYYPQLRDFKFRKEAP